MSSNAFLSWEEAVDWLVAQPDQQELVRACYYDRPVARAADRFWRSAEWEAVRALLPAVKGKVLDVGAGAGIASYALAKDGWKVVALEPDASEKVGAGAIRQLADAGHLDIAVVQEFGERIPVEDESFDAIHARQVLHHAKDLGKFCRELFRIIRPGGTLVTTRDHVISDAGQLPAFLEGHPLHRFYGGENAFCLVDYKAALKAAGFSIVRTLGPFDSVINYAPWSLAELRDEIAGRLRKIPGGGALGSGLRWSPLFKAGLWCLSRVDRRPGRLYSFVAYKPPT
jgi:SAM-dependent methyltransferase